MTEKEFINIIKQYQDNPFTHSLTCGDCGRDLSPSYFNDIIVLHCEVCDKFLIIQPYLKAIILDYHNMKIDTTKITDWKIATKYGLLTENYF